MGARAVGDDRRSERDQLSSAPCRALFFVSLVRKHREGSSEVQMDARDGCAALVPVHTHPLHDLRFERRRMSTNLSLEACPPPANDLRATLTAS